MTLTYINCIFILRSNPIPQTIPIFRGFKTWNKYLAYKFMV